MKGGPGVDIQHGPGRKHVFFLKDDVVKMVKLGASDGPIGIPLVSHWYPIGIPLPCFLFPMKFLFFDG